MNYYSTNNQAPIADLHKAVVKGLAEDRGLYMPERIQKLPKAFFDEIDKMSFIRVMSGKLRANSEAVNSASGNNEKIGKLYDMLMRACINSLSFKRP